MTLSLTLTQPGSILISGGAGVELENGQLGFAQCDVSIPGSSAIQSTEAVVAGQAAEETLFQGGRFSGLSAGSYTITWECAGGGVGSPVLALDNLSLNAWASQ